MLFAVVVSNDIFSDIFAVCALLYGMVVMALSVYAARLYHF